jgi:hypothetical protein
MENNSKEINKKDLELLNSLIIKHINYSNTNIEERDKLLWKDFLLYFKKRFLDEIGEMYTGNISIILRQLLNIDQEFHVRKGIKLTFEEWLLLYFETSKNK